MILLRIIVFICFAESFTYFSRWPLREGKLRLSWCITNYHKDLSKESVRNIVKDAFRIWSEQLSLDIVFYQRCRTPNITISWVTSDHGDNYAFDNGGGDTNILAHTFYPPIGKIHLDSFEKWSLNESDVYMYFPYVILHEIGHVLGLGHSKRKSAIMNALYKKISLKNVKLDIDDLCGIDWLYSSPSRFCLFVRLLTEF
jgi:Predicted Zn-dependent proteases